MHREEPGYASTSYPATRPQGPGGAPWPTLPRLTPDTLEFVLLSFEGPDQYAMAGGLGVRMKELALELARQGFRTHLVFIGDPELPRQESPVENLTLHRWSPVAFGPLPGRRLPGRRGQARRLERATSRLRRLTLVEPAAAAGRLTASPGRGVAHRLLHLPALRPPVDRRTARQGHHPLERQQRDGLRPHRLGPAGLLLADHHRLPLHEARDVGPGGEPAGDPQRHPRRPGPAAPTPELVARLRAAFPSRELVFKIGRFSPDKRWNMAVDALAEEKRRGHDVATVIRGGVEPHGMEVLANARARGLQVVDVHAAA